MVFTTKYTKKNEPSPPTKKKVKKFATGGMVNRAAKSDSENTPKDASRYGGADLPPPEGNERDFYNDRDAFAVKPGRQASESKRYRFKKGSAESD